MLTPTKRNAAQLLVSTRRLIIAYDGAIIAASYEPLKGANRRRAACAEARYAAAHADYERAVNRFNAIERRWYQHRTYCYQWPGDRSTDVGVDLLRNVLTQNREAVALLLNGGNVRLRVKRG